MQFRFFRGVVDNEWLTAPDDFSCHKLIHGETNLLHAALNRGIVVGYTKKIEFVGHRIREYDKCPFSEKNPLDLIAYVIQ